MTLLWSNLIIIAVKWEVRAEMLSSAALVLEAGLERTT